MTIKNKLSEKAHIFTALLMIVQPLMDIISFWFERFGLSGNITLVLRLGVLGLSVLYAFIITDNKWIYFITCSVIVLLYAGHVFAIWQAGIQSIVTDFANYVRVVQMPLSAILLISCMRMNKRGFEGMQWGMTISLWIV
ncbi:MAG: O-antigen ligase family protein, partial [Clostridia bacterium]|nr:O-antigen ligase family protein [Clostridia bacterium]